MIRKLISEKIARLKGTGLRAKSVRGVISLGIGTVTGSGLKFVRMMILTRILAPDEFGLMSLILAISMAFEAFTEVGVKQSVIQNKRGAEYEYLNVAWWMQAIRGLGLFVIAMLATPWVSSFYDKPQFLRILQVSLLVILFRGFVSPGAYILEREYKFAKAVLLLQSSSVLGTIVTVVLAFLIQNVWALVIGFVAEGAILCVLSYIFVPFLPRFRIDRECFGELWGFARGMFGLSIMAMIAAKTDVLVLGKVVTDEELGMYSLAIMLVYFPIDLFGRMINPVLLPAFAEKQENRSALCRAILEVTRVTAVFVLPFTAFMGSCASGILLLAWGAKYTAVTVPATILCLNILAQTSSFILASVYLAVGQPHLNRRFVALRAVTICTLIYPAVLYFGLSGAAIVVVLSFLVASIMQVIWCRRIIELRFYNYMRCYFPGLILSLPIIVTVGLLRLFGADSPMLVLVIGIIAFGVAITGGIFVLNRPNKPSTISNLGMDKSDYLSEIGVNDI